MKRLIIIFILFISIKAFSQDSTFIKRFSLGVGPTWGSLGWGGNMNVSYATGNKISFKLKGLYSPGMDFTYTNQPYSVEIQNRPIGEVSFSANYFLFGNTKQNSKAGLYIGLGLGYLQQINSTTYLNAVGLGQTESYTEKDISKGLSANSSVGAALKLGPGKLFVEAYFAISFIGESTTTFTFMNSLNPPRPQINKFKEGFDPEGILCINAGYIIPF